MYNFSDLMLSNISNFSMEGLTNHTGHVVIELPVWSVYVYIVFNVMILVLAVTGNGVILLVEQYNKRKTSTDWFVTLMSFNDLILAGCVIPFYILAYNGMWTTVGSDAICGVAQYIQETLSYSSTLILTATAVDRFIKTCRPLTTGITPTIAMRMCAGITIFSFTFCSPIPAFVKYDVDQICFYVLSDVTTRGVLYSMVICVHASFFVMFIVVLASYCKVGYTIRRRIKSRKAANIHVHGSMEPHCSSERKNESDSSRTRLTILSILKLKKNKVEPIRTSERDTINDSNSNKHMHDKHVIKGHVAVKMAESCAAFKLAEIGPAVKMADSRTVIEVMENSAAVKLAEGRVAVKVAENPAPVKVAESRANVKVAEGPTADKVVESRATVKVAESRGRATRTSVQMYSMKEAQMNKTTAIMLAVTVVFIVSWVPPWTASVIWPTGIVSSITGKIVYMFCRRSFIVNTCTNPLFYIGLSSSFRKLTSETFMKLWAKISFKNNYR